MNGFTKEIAQLLKVELADAYKVQRYIDENWLLDWSECSQRKMNSVVKAVASEVLA